jgi:predicted nucleic acid-binding protein
MIVKDAMVVIHLAKLSLLEKCCSHFKKAMIPEKVYEEVMRGKEEGFAEIAVIEDVINRKSMIIKRVDDLRLIRRAENFNIFAGEAESVALYWQEKADKLATDDNNVRKKRVLLELDIIGTPSIILELYKSGLIGKTKFEESLIGLREIGWFSSSVIDVVKMEGIKWEKR